MGRWGAIRRIYGEARVLLTHGERAFVHCAADSVRPNLRIVQGVTAGATHNGRTALRKLPGGAEEASRVHVVHVSERLVLPGPGRGSQDFAAQKSHPRQPGKSAGDGPTRRSRHEPGCAPGA